MLKPALLVIAMGIISAAAAANETGFLNRKVTVEGTDYRFVVYLPPDWTAERKWPVMLFLHGAGERGDDGLIQSEVGLGGAIRRHVDRYPAVVVMPQCRRNIWWTEPSMMAQALAALDQSVKEFSGDTDRLYLTGLSMGGYGTWGIGAKYPGKFAALAPVCGGIRLPAKVAQQQQQSDNGSTDPYAEAAKKVGGTPVWVFHGGADPTVPVTESRKMVEAIKSASGNVRYTEYEGVGHNSWDKAYNEPEFPTWVLAQRLAR
jgi:predicted peptidase